MSDRHTAPSPDATPGTEILRCEVGSTLHGIGLDGQEDLDLMGVTIEPRDAVHGLGSFEQHRWRTQPEGVRSGPGDVDLVVYGLKKYLRLAVKGNPSVLLLLFAPDGALRHEREHGRQLRGLRDAITSQRCIPRFLGYLHGQRQRMVEGRPSGKGRREGREAKWASHMVRLGYQGWELSTTGSLTLPMPDDVASLCRDVRAGRVSLDQALVEAREWECALQSDPSVLRPQPDLDRIQRWMHGAYLRTL